MCQNVSTDMPECINTYARMYQPAVSECINNYARMYHQICLNVSTRYARMYQQICQNVSLCICYSQAHCLEDTFLLKSQHTSCIMPPNKIAPEKSPRTIWSDPGFYRLLPCIVQVSGPMASPIHQEFIRNDEPFGIHQNDRRPNSPCAPYPQPASGAEFGPRKVRKRFLSVV